MARVRSWIDCALTEGAEVITARSPEAVDDFIPPTLLTSVPTTSPLWTEEIFAPVATTTVFDTDEEALALANDTSTGLVAYLYTSDLHGTPPIRDDRAQPRHRLERRCSVRGHRRTGHRPRGRA